MVLAICKNTGFVVHNLLVAFFKIEMSERCTQEDIHGIIG